MSAGKLRDRVTFRRRAAADDGYGNTVSGPWTDLVTEWADMLERLGGERLAAGALHAPRMATIRVRRSTVTLGITEADKVVARGEDWNIRSIAAVGRRNAMLEMTCEADVAQ
jgi:SPP1 family predicted phage head-tail adaptor